MTGLCSDAVGGIHGLSDRSGRCPYCRQRVDGPASRPPASLPVDTTDLNEAYRYHFDPDWGGGRWDT